MTGQSRKVNIETSVPLLPEQWLENCLRYHMSTEAAALCLLFERTALLHGNPFSSDACIAVAGWLIGSGTSGPGSAFSWLQEHRFVSSIDYPCPKTRAGCRHSKITLTLPRGA